MNALEALDCPTCRGSGKVQKPCELCKGSGYVGRSERGGSGDSAWAAHMQKRCPNGCSGPILRNSTQKVV